MGEEMYCAKCGASLPENAKKCDRCGTPARIRPASAAGRSPMSGQGSANIDKGPQAGGKTGRDAYLETLSGVELLRRRFAAVINSREEAADELRMNRHMKRAAEYYQAIGEAPTPVFQTSAGKKNLRAENPNQNASMEKQSFSDNRPVNVPPQPQAQKSAAERAAAQQTAAERAVEMPQARKAPVQPPLQSQPLPEAQKLEAQQTSAERAAAQQTAVESAVEPQAQKAPAQPPVQSQPLPGAQKPETRQTAAERAAAQQTSAERTVEPQVQRAPAQPPVQSQPLPGAQKSETRQTAAEIAAAQQTAAERGAGLPQVQKPPVQPPVQSQPLTEARKPEAQKPQAQQTAAERTVEMQQAQKAPVQSRQDQMPSPEDQYRAQELRRRQEEQKLAEKELEARARRLREEEEALARQEQVIREKRMRQEQAAAEEIRRSREEASRPERTLSMEEMRLQEARRIRRYYSDEPDAVDHFFGKYGMTKEAGVKIATLFLVVVLSVIYVMGRGKTVSDGSYPSAGKDTTASESSVEKDLDSTEGQGSGLDEAVPTGGGDFENTSPGADAQQEGEDTQEPAGE